MSKTIIQPEDYKYYVATPDASFSPERNKAIINETIQETEKFFREMGKVMTDGLAERIDVLASYGKYRLNSGGSKSYVDYVGKSLRDKLIGEKILSKVRVMDSVNRLNGNTKYSKFIQL